MIRRVDACLNAFRTDRTAYLQHGWEPEHDGM
jgi:hypothetical protein